MSNSALVTYTHLSPNYNARNHKIDKITIHHMAVVNGSLEGVGNAFARPEREASSNYAIDSKGSVALYVDEANRAWTSGNRENDMRAVTIEVANCKGEPNWEINAVAMAKLIELCVDICKRNGIAKLIWTGDATGNLTTHDMFQATGCPGPYLKKRMGNIADEVNKKLAVPEKKTLYRVQVGAFSVKANADAMLAKLKAAGFDGFITKVE